VLCIGQRQLQRRRAASVGGAISLADLVAEISSPSSPSLGDVHLARLIARLGGRRAPASARAPARDPTVAPAVAPSGSRTGGTRMEAAEAAEEAEAAVAAVAVEEEVGEQAGERAERAEAATRSTAPVVKDAPAAVAQRRMHVQQATQYGGDSVQRAERGDSVRRLQRGGVPLLRCLLTMAHHNTTYQDSDLPWLHFPWLYTH
jgi:hypothetical protein